MILHAIELHHVGRFRESVRIGPFTTGLNILAALNEAGKSTSLQAAARALFDRHSTKSEEIKSLQPAGTDLAPRIVVEFATSAGRYRIEKTFLHKPTSELRVWQDEAWALQETSDQADQKVQALLQSSLPGRGATKPEHWGFLSYLWARQGERPDWPDLNAGDAGQAIRSKLVQLQIDPVIDALRQRLGAMADAVLTSTGQAKANGPLRAAEEDLARIEEELTQLRESRAKLDDALVRFQQASGAVAQLEKEQAEKAEAAESLRIQAQAAERLQVELTGLQQALTTAEEKLATVTTDVEQLAQLRERTEAADKSITDAERNAAEAKRQSTNLRTLLETKEAERPQRESALQARREKLERVRSLLRWRELSAAEQALARQVTKAEAIADDLAKLSERIARIADISPTQLRKLETLAEQVTTLEAQLRALGLTVELTPETDTTVGTDGQPGLDLSAGETTTLNRPQRLDLQLPGWGRIAIRSGAKETENVAKDGEKAKAGLQAALEKAEVPTLDAARAAVSERQELNAQAKTLQATLTAALGEHEDLEMLREAAAAATRRVETLVTTLQPTDDERALTQTELDADEATQAEALPAEEKALKTFDRELEDLRTQERATSHTAQDADKALQEQHNHRRVAESQLNTLTARYADGLEAAKKAAQLAFAQAEARVEATKAQLPTDHDKLSERNKRAAVSLQQIANELQQRRTERDASKGTLETLGGQGLYSRETALEEKKEEATLRRDAARMQGWAARIAGDLIEHRKQAATKAVLTPLEQRLSAAFGEMTGNPERRVFLNEQLQVVGIGRTREAMHGYDHLSQGAKEQLLLCLRLAVAHELAAEEPQVLILDDVLVNTDPVRQERILDVLGAQAERLQILILTCHPDRYRGVGELIDIV